MSAGIILLTIGIAIAVSAVVSTGIFAITRNPMYLGMSIGLLAWAVCLGPALALLGPVAFALFITRFQIIPEDRAMHALFGPEFSRYAQSVRRWL